MQDYNWLVETKVTFSGLHHWSRAANYLAQTHRHLFVIRARKSINHGDRDVEFIELGNSIRQFIVDKFEMTKDGTYNLGETSCESLALMLYEAFDLDSCWVHEDDENGGGVERCTRS